MSRVTKTILPGVRARAHRGFAPGAALLLAGLAFLSGCDRRTGEAAEPAPPPVAVEESTALADESLRRFTTGLGATPAGISGGAEAMDAIARRYLLHLRSPEAEPWDSVFLSRAEFAHLYYPAHPSSAPPYALPVDALWTITELEIRAGSVRIAAELPGEGAREVTARCGATAPLGELTIHRGCVLVVSHPGRGDPVTIPWGALVEFGGVLKVVSLAE